MARGPLGFRRFTSIPPLVRGDEDILYHFTNEESLNSILKEGFEKGYEQSIEVAGYIREDQIASIAGLDKSIDELKPRRLSYLPNRFGANFFFPDRQRPKEILNRKLEAVNVGGKIIIVMVDSSKIPCKGARVEYSTTKSINDKFFNDETPEAALFFPEGTDKPGLLEVKMGRLSKEYKMMAREFWSKVELYKGNNISGYEVWFNCDIPPEAIAGVINPLEEFDA